MASTRTNNTPGNYCLQQRQYQESRQYTGYKNSAYGQAYDTKLPGNGLNPAQIPWNKLSKNSADIESFLFGINSTNLVNPSPIFVSEPNPIMYENLYQPKPTYMPLPLVIERNRPFPNP